jgi:hypothetical protein
VTASAATSAAATVAATGGSFWGYFLSFLFGGVFFSTALGVATIFISVGSANVQRAWRVFRFLASRVWKLVAATFDACASVAQGGGPDLERHARRVGGGPR